MQIDSDTINLFRQAFENITPVISTSGSQITFQNTPNARKIRLSRTASTQVRGFGYTR